MGRSAAHDSRGERREHRDPRSVVDGGDILYDAAMRWLVHGKLQSSVSEALRRHGHATRAPAELRLTADASAAEVFSAARRHQVEVVTSDPSLAAAPYADHVPFGRCLVFLHVGDGEVEQDDAIDRLFLRYKRLTPGRMYTITPSRVKIRQLPGEGSEIRNIELIRSDPKGEED